MGKSENRDERHCAASVPFNWPERPFHIVLVEPEIPQNTGNIARLCAATGSFLHLVGPLGFRVSDKAVKRAGLDYWDSVTLFRHKCFDDFIEEVKPVGLCLFSVRGYRSYFDAGYRPGTALVFGSESRGLPEDLRMRFKDNVYTIPMKEPSVRSLNLANCASLVLYEALRQTANPA